MCGPGARPLPQSKYAITCSAEYVPAPLDMNSVWNGLAKFDHVQKTVPTDFWPYAEAVLDYFYPLMRQNSGMSTLDEVECKILAHEHKTAGYPCNNNGCATKGEALQSFGIKGLLSMYTEESSIIGVTLKDELRRIGKDARLFRPMDVCAYAEALTLFDKQNEYLMSNLFYHPSFVRYKSPGLDLGRLYRRLGLHGGDKYDSDANAWDANFPLAIAEFLCYWRSRGHAEPKRVREYYRRMYNGYSSFGGLLYNLVGQPSGHLLTTVDNSLGNIVLMSYHAFRNHLSVETFLSEVLFYVCGDDLIWADRTGLFSPTALSESYFDLGVFLEFESLEPKSFEALSFVGTHPRTVVFNNCRVQSYVYDVPKLSAKSLVYKKNCTDVDRLVKLCAYAQLLFNDADAYNVLCKLCDTFYSDSVRIGTISPVDKRALGSLSSITAQRLQRVYGGFELT